MNEQELTQAVNGLRDQVISLMQRITALEGQVETLIERERELANMRRQMLLAVFGVGLAQLVGLLWVVIKLAPNAL